MDLTRTYSVGGSGLTLRFADIVSSDSEILVSSDDFLLTMSGGVSSAIRSAAGSSLVLDAAKSVPCQAGDVVVTTAGALKARYVFHAVTIGPDGSEAAREVVRSATRRCLELVTALNASSISFPALGTGSAGFSMEDSAVAMAEVIAEYVSVTSRPLNIDLYFFARGHLSPLDYIRFYEEFARRVPAVEEVAPSVTPTSSQSAHAEPLTSLLELERTRQLLEAELVKRRASGQGDGDLLVRLRENQDQRLVVAEREQDERQPPVSVFISYAHEDEGLQQELVKHLAGLKRAKAIREWYDREIVAGMDWKSEIDHQLDQAKVVLFLLSPDFMASDYCVGVETERAIERHERGEALLIPVLLRAVDWRGSVFGRFHALPRDAKPITQWRDRDEALLDVVQGVRRAVERIAAEAHAPQ